MFGRSILKELIILESARRSRSFLNDFYGGVKLS